MASGTACAKIQTILNCFQIKTVQDLVSPSLSPGFCDDGFIFSLYLMDTSNSRLISFWLLTRLKRKRALSPVPEKVFYCISLALSHTSGSRSNLSGQSCCIISSSLESGMESTPFKVYVLRVGTGLVPPRKIKVTLPQDGHMDSGSTNTRLPQTPHFLWLCNKPLQNSAAWDSNNHLFAQTFAMWSRLSRDGSPLPHMSSAGEACLGMEGPFSGWLLHMNGNLVLDISWDHSSPPCGPPARLLGLPHGMEAGVQEEETEVVRHLKG